MYGCMCTNRSVDIQGLLPSTYCSMSSTSDGVGVVIRPVARGGSLGSDEPPFQIVKKLKNVMFTRIDYGPGDAVLG